MRVISNLAKIDTKFSNYLEKIRDEGILGIGDGGRVRGMFV